MTQMRLILTDCSNNTNLNQSQQQYGTSKSCHLFLGYTYENDVLACTDSF